MWKPKLGTFSKALSGSVSLNYSESGSTNCSDTCPLKKSGCYAVNTELMKPSVRVSGERKRLAGMIECNNNYFAELVKIRDGFIPWVRFSTFGSVPKTPTKKELESLAYVLNEAKRVSGGNVHFPIESLRKYKLYLSTVEKAGLVIRLSLNFSTVAKITKAVRDGLKVSTVVKRVQGESTKQRIKRSRKLAKRLKNNGVRASVCPAIVATLTKAASVKCGQCTLCSRGNCDVVIYPQH